MAIVAERVADFDTWRESFGGASIEFLRPNSEERVSIFSDPQATIQLEQPIILDTRNQGDRNYGKFEFPIYVQENYQLRINGVDQTGIIAQAILALQGRDIGEALAKAARGNRFRRVTDHLDNEIRALDYGELGDSSATNTLTIERAIGAAAGQGGGRVRLPRGTYQITTLTLPVGVILSGEGQAATTLQSEEASDVITLSGDGAGLEELTLDGLNLNAGSVGVAGIGIANAVLRLVTVKRFRVGIRFRGLTQSLWIALSVDNCFDGVELLGDLDSGGSTNGGPVEANEWIGGIISNHTTTGLKLFFEDQVLRNNTFRDLQFLNNTGTAILIEGARYTRFETPGFNGNTKSLDIKDGSDMSQVALNTILGFFMTGGRMNGGEVEFAGTCRTVTFKEMAFAGVAFTLTAPKNNIMIVDSTEDAQTNSAGTVLRLQRISTHDLEAETTGVTTDATPTVAWDRELRDGENAIVEAKIVGNRRDGVGHALYHIEQAVQRPGATLNYDNLLVAFTVGQIVTGQTSGATGRITADASSALTLRTITGTFQDNEQIKDEGTGEATVNGALVQNNAALLGSITNVITPIETTAAMAAIFTVSIGNVEVSLTGVASQIWDWTVRMKFQGQD